ALPISRHPVITGIRPGPVARRPDVIVTGTRRLSVHGQRWRRLGGVDHRPSVISRVIIRVRLIVARVVVDRYIPGRRILLIRRLCCIRLWWWVVIADRGKIAIGVLRRRRTDTLRLAATDDPKGSEGNEQERTVYTHRVPDGAPGRPVIENASTSARPGSPWLF